MGATETSIVFADRACDAAAGAPTRRDDIVEAARELYEERGLSRTTVKDITQRVGVTRSLFYHYFSDKDAVTDAVLDDIVGDFLEALRYWNAGRERGNVDKALTDCLRIFRNGIFENGSFRRSLASTENSALYLHFVQTVADRVARYIVDSTVRDFERSHKVEIEYVYETFYMMVVGLTGLIRANPQISDSAVKRIVAQTLRIEGYLDGGESGSAPAGAPANGPVLANEGGAASAPASDCTLMDKGEGKGEGGFASKSVLANDRGLMGAGGDGLGIAISGSSGTGRADERGTRPRTHS